MMTGNDLSRLATIADHKLTVGLSLISISTVGGEDTFVLTHGCLAFYDPEGEQLFGNQSSRATQDQPASAPASAGNLFYTAVPKKDWDDAWGFLVGPSFRGDKFPSLASLLTGARTHYVIAAVNIGFITAWGADGVPIGVLSDEITQFLETSHSLGPIWKQLVVKHNPAVGEAILANLDELKSVLPAVPSSMTVESSPFCSWAPLSAADQQRWADACAKNTANLESFLTPITPLGASLTLGSAGTRGDVEEMSTVSTPKQPSSSTKISDGEGRMSKFILFGGRFPGGADNTTSFVAPTIKQDAAEVIGSNSKGYALDQFWNLLQDQQKLAKDNRDRLIHKAALTAGVDENVQPLLLNLKPAGEFATLKGMASTKKGITALFFLKDTAEVRKSRLSLADGKDVRDLEHMRDEHYSKRTKIDTDILVVDNVSHLDQLLILLANCVLLCMTVYEYEATKNEPDAPLLHSMAYQIETVLVSEEFESWYQLLPAPSKVAFHYWMLDRINSILHKILTLSNAVTHLPKAIRGEYHLLTPNLHDGVVDQITLAVGQMTEWINSRTVSVQPTPLYLSSPQYEKHQLAAAKERVSETPRTPRNPGPTGQLKTPGTDSSRNVPAATPRAAGEIIQSTRGEMPHFARGDFPQGFMRLCIPHLKDGTKGCRTPNCIFDHPNSMDDWHPRVVDAYCRLVAAHDSLSWNKEVVPKSFHTKLKLD